MFIQNGKRVNINAPIVFNNVQYPNLADPQLRKLLGVQEVPEPEAPADYDRDLYYFHELDEAPYVVYTKKSDEQVSQVLLLRAKQARAAAIDSLTVTSASGNVFDADEVSQNRLARAISVLEDSETLPWVLADNSVIAASKTELVEVLRLAGAAMALEWVKPYTP